MKSTLLAISLFFIPIYGFSYPCKLMISEGISYFGHCHDNGKNTIFRSCLDFECIVPSSKVDSLKNPSCGEDPSLKEWTSIKEKDLKPCQSSL